MSKKKEENLKNEEVAEDENVATTEADSGKKTEKKKKNQKEKVVKSAIDDLKDEITKKDEEIESLKKELAETKDTMIRRHAEFDNFKKRNIKLQEDKKRLAVKSMGLEIISINDNLHRALEASTIVEEQDCMQSHKSFVDGVSMISGTINKILENSGITEIDALNKEFDPNLHEAVSIVESDEVEKELVTTVYQKGYVLGDLVVRSAKVIVSKPVPKKQDDSEEKK